MTHTYDVGSVRRRFPALRRMEEGLSAAYLDGPGGTQVPESVIDAMTTVLNDGVSNVGGGFGSSTDAQRTVSRAREAMGRMFHSAPSNISFGQNMTSLTFAMSRALGATWREGEAVVLTDLDHDANYTPWVMAARDAGADVRVARFDSGSGLLSADAVVDLLDERVRLVAVCLASNALGTIVDVPAISREAHRAGALVYVDAVHAAPHVRIDVDELDCDFLVASAYKFFGPHTGVLYGSTEQMTTLPAYKVRPAPANPPGKWETGTQSFESLAGVAAAVEHLEWVGHQSIHRHESELGRRFLDGVDAMAHVRLYGVPEMNDERVPTFAIGVEGTPPDQVAARMAQAGVYVWSGHYYAISAMDRLGALDSGGLVRIGFVHYNTAYEVDRSLQVLSDLGS